jgi:uncharacterized damage-inducible protein DinB
MNELIAPIAHQIALSAHLFDAALADLTDEEVGRRPSPDSNSMLWLAGHLTGSRCGLLNALGGKREFPWDELFRRGSKGSDPDRYPSIREVVTLWKDVSVEIAKRLEALTDDALKAPAPFGVPVPDKSLRGVVAFLAYHETYHIGQMAFVRKWLGKGGLVD